MKKSILRFASISVLLLTLSCKALVGQTAQAPSGTGTSGDPYLIANLENLYWVAVQVNGGDLAGAHFEQTANIDASATSGWFEGQGWVPIGNSWQDRVFEGYYDGGENKIYNLTINRPSEEYVGLFGIIMNATLKNIEVNNVEILGIDSGALAGFAVSGNTILNCSSTGVVVGEGTYAGGLIGIFRFSNMELCSSNATVMEGSNAGGLCGIVDGSLITNSHSTGTVTGFNTVGGLVGNLVRGGEIANCFSRGDVTGGFYTGGLVGQASDLGTLVKNSYSLGSVSGSSDRSLGGFCGYLYGAIIENSFSAGNVIYTDNANPTDKGFIAINNGDTFGNFFDSETSNQSTATGATPLTTAEMTRAGTFVSEGWEFRESEQAWGFNGEDNGGYPFLRHQGYQPKRPLVGPDFWQTGKRPETGAKMPSPHKR
jgi:hypothetical protein